MERWAERCFQPEVVHLESRTEDLGSGWGRRCGPELFQESRTEDLGSGWGRRCGPKLFLLVGEGFLRLFFLDKLWQKRLLRWLSLTGYSGATGQRAGIVAPVIAFRYVTLPARGYKQSAGGGRATDTTWRTDKTADRYAE
jgi:hypothetical protein